MCYYARYRSLGVTVESQEGLKLWLKVVEKANQHKAVVESQEGLKHL